MSEKTYAITAAQVAHLQAVIADYRDDFLVVPTVVEDAETQQWFRDRIEAVNTGSDILNALYAAAPLQPAIVAVRGGVAEVVSGQAQLADFDNDPQQAAALVNGVRHATS